MGAKTSKYLRYNYSVNVGAIDIVAVEYPDGRVVSTPFHVRFGKVGVVRASDKIVSITINGHLIEGVTMKLGKQGEAFFVVPVDDLSPRTNRPDQEIEYETEWMTSPLPSPPYSDDECQEGEGGAARLGERHRAYTSDGGQLHVESNSMPPASFHKRARSTDHHPSSKLQEAQDLGAAEASSDEEADEQSISRRSSVQTRRRAKSMTDVIASNTASNTTLPEGDSGERDEIEWKYGHPVPKLVSSSSVAGRTSSNLRTNVTSETVVATPPTAAAVPEACLSDSGLSNANSLFDLSGSPPQNTTISALDVDPPALVVPSNIDNPEPLSLNELQNADPSIKDAYGLAARPADSVENATFELSLYGSHMAPGKPIDGALWDECKVSEVQFQANPFVIMTNPELRVKYNNKYMTWTECAPYMVSLCVFGRKLANNFQEQQRLRHLSSSLLDKQASMEAESATGASVQAKTKSNFFSFLMRSPATANTEASSGSSALNTPLKIETGESDHPAAAKPHDQSSPNSQTLIEDVEKLEIRDNPPVAPEEVAEASPNIPEEISESTVETVTERGGVRRRLTYSDQQRRSTVDVIPAVPKRSSHSETLHNENDDGDIETFVLQKRSQSADDEEALDKEVASLTKRWKKSLNLTSEQLNKMNLNHGRNEVVFSVTTQYQGTTKCHAAIYLFKYTDRLVISDIDGTITKSDVIGMVMPAVGGGSGWTHPGVASLYRNIQHNGYKFVYLSSRAIGQASMTKSYLDQVEQHGLRLPHGPVLLSPNSLFNAFKREVVYRNPEEFKTECLEHVANLFPESYNPFYAGFGNKVNDRIAYDRVQIPKHRIYIINTKSEVRPQNEALAGTFTTSYETLVDVVDYHFPVIRERALSVAASVTDVTVSAGGAGSPVADILEGDEVGDAAAPPQVALVTVPNPSITEFNSSNFWRSDLPDISSELDQFKK